MTSNASPQEHDTTFPRLLARNCNVICAKKSSYILGISGLCEKIKKKINTSFIQGESMLTFAAHF